MTDAVSPKDLWPEPEEAPTHLGTIEYRDIGEGPALVVELVGRRKDQYAWRDAIKTFAEDIRWWNEPSAKAVGWRLSPWVGIDPDVQFGAPVVTGTRIPIRTIAANLEEGSPEEVAAWYDLDTDAVRGVADYLALAS